jgi:uncharacterized protein (DUF305 family)
VSSIAQYPQNFNILSTIDLIDHMVGHHQDQALELVELALWHQQQADALAVERQSLAADVSAALAEAERFLQ